MLSRFSRHIIIINTTCITCIFFKTNGEMIKENVSFPTCFPGCPSCTRANAVRAFDELLGESAAFPIMPLKEANLTNGKRSRKNGPDNSLRTRKRASTTQLAHDSYATIVDAIRDVHAYRVLVMRSDKWNGEAPPCEPKAFEVASPEEREDWWNGVVQSYQTEGGEVVELMASCSHDAGETVLRGREKGSVAWLVVLDFNDKCVPRLVLDANICSPVREDDDETDELILLMERFEKDLVEGEQ